MKMTGKEIYEKLLEQRIFVIDVKAMVGSGSSHNSNRAVPLLEAELKRAEHQLLQMEHTFFHPQELCEPQCGTITTMSLEETIHNTLKYSKVDIPPTVIRIFTEELTKAVTEHLASQRLEPVDCEELKEPQGISIESIGMNAAVPQPDEFWRLETAIRLLTSVVDSGNVNGKTRNVAEDFLRDLMVMLHETCVSPNQCDPSDR